jgi:ParB family chromosome partitioning protein
MSEENEMMMAGEKLGFLTVEVEALVPHPDNRGMDNGLEMQELVASIKEVGILQPLVVRELPLVGGQYEILAGHRRVHAARELGMTEVNVVVRYDCSDEEAMAILFIENFERKALNAMEEAEGLDAWMRICDVSLSDVARRIARPVDYVQAMLRLNDLDTAARKLVRSGGVKRETLMVLGGVRDDVDFTRAAQLVLFPGMQSEPLNARQARQVIAAEIDGPRKARDGWNGQREKREKTLQKTWKKMGLKVRVPEYDEMLQIRKLGEWVFAEGLLLDSMLLGNHAGKGVCWGQIAAAHDLCGYLLASEEWADRVYVRRDLCESGEWAKAEHGMERFLVGKVEAAARPVVDEEEDFPDADEEDAGAPPEERHVRRESGSMIEVPRDRIVRAMELIRAGVDVELEESDLLDLPAGYLDLDVDERLMREVYANLMPYSAALMQKMLQWVLDGCPVLGSIAELDALEEKQNERSGADV